MTRLTTGLRSLIVSDRLDLRRTDRPNNRDSSSVWLGGMSTSH
jgi:hypothetical protein